MILNNALVHRTEKFIYTILINEYVPFKTDVGGVNVQQRSHKRVN